MEARLIAILILLGIGTIGAFIWFFLDLDKRDRAWNDNFDAAMRLTIRH